MGDKYETKNYMIFFGSRHATWEVLPKLFPKIQFAKLKQTHGNSVVESPSDEVQEADSHWTANKNVALTIVTADCLPIMILDQNKIGAVHAGWRGIENRALLKTLQSGFSKNLKVFIGPHIRRPSFEVRNDVSEKLVSSAKNLTGFDVEKSIFPHTDAEKKYVDLSHIAHCQLNFFGVTDEDIYLSPHNTFTNEAFSSYRRKENPTGRQISFIVLLDSI